MIAPEKIALKVLPKSSVTESLNALGRADSEPCEAFLCRLLNQDASHCVFLWNEARSVLTISTPRLYLRTFLDKYDERVLIVTSARRPSSVPRGEYRSGLKQVVEWRALPDGAFGSASRLIAAAKAVTARVPSADVFWEYWQEFLDAERRQVDQVKHHGGWEYTARRHGVGKSLEFRVGEYADAIIAECHGRILVDLDSIAATISETGKQISMELHSTGSAAKWICATPLYGGIEIERIPQTGNLQPDWRSVRSLLKRRETALFRLREGSAALPQLSVWLPGGPQTETPFMPVPPKIAVNYDEGQREAIAKAIVPGSITTILGPPGTGKTAVIAEIAAQVSASGGRVLISSQTNLAVDNALERMADIPDLFAVRVGIPESVKLNAELTLDRASERYRKRLLERSRNRQAEEQLWLRSAALEPTSKEITEIIDGLGQLHRSENETQIYRDRWKSAKAASDEAKQSYAGAAFAMREFSRKTGIDTSCIAKLKELRGEIGRKGWNIAAFAGRQVQMEKALAGRALIVRLESFIYTRKNAVKAAADLQLALDRAQSRVSRTDYLEKAIRERMARNAEIDRARASTHGVLDWFKKHLFTLKDAIEPLESELRSLDRARESAIVVNSEKRLSENKKQQVELSSAIHAGLVSLGCNCSSLMLEESSVVNLKQNLEYANFLEVRGGLILASQLAYTEEAASTERKLLDARVSLALTDKAEASAQQTCEQVEQRLKRVLEGNYYQKFLSICPEHIRDELSEDTSDQLEFLLLQLQSYWSDRRDRRGRSPKIEAALAMYHARLQDAEVDLTEAVIADANVVAATCTGIATAKEFQSDFDTVIIDEAGRATPLDLLIPMVRGKSIVLVGDHKQLPPTIDRTTGQAMCESGWNDPDLQISLFQQLFTNSHTSRTKQLHKQYRMVPAICYMVRDLSYRDVQVEAAGYALEREHPFKNEFPSPVVWIRCHGESNLARLRNKGGSSPENECEASAVLNCLKRMASQIEGRAEKYQVGVISMYKAQVTRIERELVACGLHDDQTLSIEVGTVDSFQGRQKDAILVSLVETDPQKNGFFYDVRRLNVALSRASELLVVIGMVDELGKNPRTPNGSARNPLHHLYNYFNHAIEIGDLTKEVFQN